MLTRRETIYASCGAAIGFLLALAALIFGASIKALPLGTLMGFMVGLIGLWRSRALDYFMGEERERARAEQEMDEEGPAGLLRLGVFGWGSLALFATIIWGFGWPTIVFLACGAIFCLLATRAGDRPSSDEN